MNRITRRKMSTLLSAAALSPTATRAQLTATPIPVENREEVYLGAAITWFTLAYWSIERFHEAADEMGDEWEMNTLAPAMFAEMGVWKALLLDAQAVVPPPTYAEFHDFILEKLENLERASRYYTDGILLGDMDLVRAGSKFYNESFLRDQEYFEDAIGRFVVPRSFED